MMLATLAALSMLAGPVGACRECHWLRVHEPGPGLEPAPVAQAAPPPQQLPSMVMPPPARQPKQEAKKPEAPPEKVTLLPSPAVVSAPKALAEKQRHFLRR